MRTKIRVKLLNDAEKYDGSNWIVVIKIFQFALLKHGYLGYYRIVNLNSKHAIND